MKKCKRLLSIFLAVMMLLGCVQAAFIVGAESASTVKVATISDIRYQAGAADKDGLMLSKSAALLDAAIAKVKASDADVLLVTGDLTNNGSKTSHQYVASKLAEVETDVSAPILRASSRASRWPVTWVTSALPSRTFPLSASMPSRTSSWSRALSRVPRMVSSPSVWPKGPAHLAQRHTKENT